MARLYNGAFPIFSDFDVIDDHEMVLFPMHDARQGRFGQLLKRNMHANRTEADAFGGGADAEHAHPLPPDEALLPERLQRVMLAIVLSYHPQTGGAAIHGVELLVKRKLFTHYTAYKG